MSHATITADVDQALDVQLDLAAQIALDAIFAVQDLADPPNLLLGQVAHSDVRVDVGFLENVKPIRVADTKDIGDRNLDLLVTRDVNPSNTCHTALLLSGLSLALLTPRLAARSALAPIRDRLPENGHERGAGAS